MFEGHGFGFGGGFMWLSWILLIVVIVVIVWALKATAFSNRKDGGTDMSPLEILRKRFARGEIDEEEYERKRELLSD